MNWVGGARSRVRQQTDRKLQKEFFERKRLEAKAKKPRVRSPQDGTRKAISKDLLSLQAASRIHASWNDNRDRPPPHIRKLKLTGPRANWPERNLVLPMSPIGDPSALEFHDTSYDAGSHFRSLYTNAPKVSTQKLPHYTALDSFGPAPPWKKSKSRGIPNQSSRNNCFWTESVLPTHAKDAPRAAPHNQLQAAGARLGDSLLMTESVVPEGAGKGRKGKEKRPTMFGTYVDLAKAENRKRKSVAEKSYDHETPFNFGFHAPKGAGAPHKFELPKTQPSLLDFHSSENPTRPERPQTRKNESQEGDRPAPAKAQPRNSDMGTANTAQPLGTAPEPQGGKAKEDRTLLEERNSTSNSHNKSSTGFSSLFDEDPLSNKCLGRQTPSTVFCESILGPLHRKRRLHPNEPSATSLPEPKQQRHDDHEAMVGGLKSAFEEMMSKFDANSMSHERGQGIGLGYVGERGKGGETGVAKLDRERGHVGLSHVAGAGQHREWQHFISGASGETGQGRPRDTASHTQWQHFVSGTSADLKNEPDNSQTSQEEKSTAALRTDCRDGLIIASDNQPRRKLGNISVMDELMCLEEIGSSMDSDALASQEVSFTPNVSHVQQVPDVDTDIGNMTENPLNIGHTPYQQRPYTQSVYYRDHPNATVALPESVCNEGSSQMACSVASQGSMSEQTSVEPQGKAPSSTEIQESVLAHEVMGSEREEQSMPHSSGTVGGPCGSDGVTVNSIPVEVQPTALHLMPTTCVATQTEVEGDPAQSDAVKAATLPSVIQCSTGLEQTSQITSNPANKSVQTDITGTLVSRLNCEEKGVQVNALTDAAETMSGPKDNSCTTELNMNHCSCGNELASSVKGATSEDESVTLREELKKTQNTVIWQSLMLRLYAMH